MSLRFLAWMEGQGFKRFLARCELRGCLDDVKPVGARVSRVFLPPASLTMPEAAKPAKPSQEKTLFAFHPHGAVCFGFTANGIFDSAFVSKSAPRWHFDACARYRHGMHPTLLPFLCVKAKIAFLIDDFLRNGNPIFRLLCDTCPVRM